VTKRETFGLAPFAIPGYATGTFHGASRNMSSKDDRAAAVTTDDPADRRTSDRFDVEWSVDCVASDTFLFASITNISAMGIFVRTIQPLKPGTRLVLSFAPPGDESFKLEGTVAWVNKLRSDGDNPNPGMGIRFINLKPEERERLVEVIRTIAYLRDPN
jgi:type IV pilus assembly protein PilZ